MAVEGIPAWKCVAVGSAACAGIVHVARWIVADYAATYPIPDCAPQNCDMTIPAALFRPGGRYSQEAIMAHDLGDYAAYGMGESYYAGGGAVAAAMPDQAGATVSTIGPTTKPPAVNVPEPGGLAVFAIAAAALVCVRRKRRSARDGRPRIPNR